MKEMYSFTKPFNESLSFLYHQTNRFCWDEYLRWFRNSNLKFNKLPSIIYRQNLHISYIFQLSLTAPLKTFFFFINHQLKAISWFILRFIFFYYYYFKIFPKSFLIFLGSIHFLQLYCTILVRIPRFHQVNREKRQHKHTICKRKIWKKKVERRKTPNEITKTRTRNQHKVF